MFTGYEAEILFRLLSQVFQNNLDLVFSANHVVLFVIWVLFLLFFLIVLILDARRKRETRVTLEEIPLLLKLFLVLWVSIILEVDEKLVNYAAETPQIR